ncbi:MAG TPA: ATP-binding protein [Alphaproteobacteria bacterium]|nr:ATP-binding protein [Alphaproteobacteria bacterium]
MTNDQTFRTKVVVGMAAIVFLLLTLGYGGLHSADEQEQNLERLDHTYQVKSAIDDLLVDARNITSGQRSYVVSGSAEGRALFEKAAQDIPQLLANLRFLVRDNPDQIERTDGLTALFNERLNEGLSIITRRDDGDIEGSYNQLLNGRGPALTDLINQQARIMADVEEQLLNERLTKTGQTAQQTKYILTGGVSIAVLGICLAVFAVFRDLRRRLITEQALRDSTAKLEDTLSVQRALVQSAGYAIIAVDIEGLVSNFNPAAERMLGWHAAEVVGKAGPERFIDAADLAAHAQKLGRELDTTLQSGLETLIAKPLRGQAYEDEWLMLRKDGNTLPAQLSINAIHNNEGLIQGFLIIASDITERKKIERLKNEFISTVSHELRTPLTSIRGSLGLVLGGIAGQLTTQGKSLIDIAHKNAERLGRLINDILDIEKIESGKMEFQMKRQPLAPLLKQAVESTADYGVQYGVTFKLSDEAHGIGVDVDGDRLIQVMANLLSNAAKFSPQGGVVEVAAVLTGRNVRISVADKGKGIPAEFHDRIFQKFAQADSSDTRQKGGTGLGLSIVKAMVEHMGGQVGFESVPEQGTTFFVDLPAANASAIDDARPAGAPVRPRVLICEDDEDIALLLRMMLDQGGFDSDIATTAAEAAARLETPNAYVALTLDIALPDKTGLDLFRDLRAAPATQALPVIFVSAEADKGRKELNGAAIGVVDWLQKPIDAQRLLQAIRLAARKSPDTGAVVLHVEDDLDLVHVVSGIIQPVARIEAAHSLAEARGKLASGAHYDLVLLDLGLPDGDGSELLPLIPKDLPVLIFSAYEVPEELSRKVASALTKSRTSNEALFRSITAIIDKMTAQRLS